MSDGKVETPPTVWLIPLICDDHCSSHPASISSLLLIISSTNRRPSAAAARAMIRVDHHHHATKPPSDLLAWEDAQFLQVPFDVDQQKPPLANNPPSHTAPSPPTPPPATATSPTRVDDRSSPLSPVPPTFNPLAQEKEAPIEIPQREEEEEDEGTVDPPPPQPQVRQEPNNADPGPSSRQSTPLSELSPPPPDQDDEQDGDDAPMPHPQNPRESEKDSALTHGAAADPLPTSITSPPPTDQKPTPAAPLLSFSNSASDFHSQPMTQTTTASHDPKVVSILELNVEMFKYFFSFFFS